MKVSFFFFRSFFFDGMPKPSLIIYISLFIANIAAAQNEFITTWKTDNIGVSNTSSIIIPTTGPGYNYDVDWDNDGVFDEFGILGNATHDFLVPGVYTIRIRGDFPRIYFNNEGDKRKIISIDQWGNIGWKSMEFAFFGARNLKYNATDTPNLSVVTNMAAMFRNCFLFNGNIGTWDVSTITNMSQMFQDADAFNRNLDAWDVSSVTDMSEMFRGCDVFDRLIVSWNVSSVIDMNRMFFAAPAFNRDISSWDVSNVKNMEMMFRNASAFDQNLGNWNISNVNNMVDMLSSSGLSVASYDATLIGWAAQTVKVGVTLGAVGLFYCIGEEARASLISDDSWTIIGDNKVPTKFVR